MSLFKVNPAAQTQATQPAQTVMPQAPAQAFRQPAPAPVAPQGGTFSGIDDVFDQRRAYVEHPGLLLLKVVKLARGLYPAGHKRAGQTFFCADFEVIQSDLPQHQPGSPVAWMSTKNPQFPKFFLIETKSFIASLFGVDQSLINESTMEDAISEGNPAAGKLVYMRTKPNTKANKQGVVAINPNTQTFYMNSEFLPYQQDQSSSAA